MRKVVLSIMISVDGYIEGTNDDLNWHVWDEEMEHYMLGFFKTVDTFIYGRKSYELMLSYWPSEKGEFAQIMNETPKIVFSKTLKTVEWNSNLLKDLRPEEIKKLKQEPGKDLVLFAGANLASSFMQNNLIDEYRFIVNPVVLGGGTLLFQGIKNEINLQLKNIRTFSCGNVLLVYTPHYD